jgi:uncharacterized SAM-binding protein YcdF (DUF218 family)
MLYYLLNDILRPYTLLVLVLVIAQAFLWRKRVERRRRLLWITIPVLALYVYSLPAVSFLLFGTLEWQFPPLKVVPQDAQAIVVLSGGIYPPDSVRKKAQLESGTLYRCLHAAELYHAGPRLIVLTGGKVDPQRKGPKLAEAMREFMVKLGVADDDIVLETESRTTHENALYTAELLRQRGIDHVVLVTDATHLRRAKRCFEVQGLRVTPSGCRYRATEFNWRVAKFLPKAGAAAGNQDVVHEWLGLTWYWLKGRI